MSKANKTADLVSQALYGFKNKIVDGRFDFWYEGTSSSIGNGYYGTDTMWLNLSSGSTKTHSQQPLVAGVDLPAIDCPTAQYFSRTVINSVAGAANYVIKWHRIENVATLAGKTVTLSFYAKADAVKSISLGFAQNFGSGGSSQVNLTGQSVSLSTAWTRYSLQFTLPSISGKTIGAGSYLQLQIGFDLGSNFSGVAPYAAIGQQSGTFDIACVQLEEGSVATPFEELPIEVSQQRVNRYFWKTGYIRRDVYAGSTSDDSFIDIKLPTTMRVSPSVSVTGLVTNLTGITYQTTNLDFIIVYATGGVAGGNHWLVSTLTADARL